jgi:acetolactate synthase-1/2/3 large subunit
VPYVVDSALALLQGLRHIVPVGARPPVGFFAYPGKPSLLAPRACVFTTLATVEEDIDSALQALADELGARGLAPVQVAEYQPPALPEGPATPDGVAAVVAALLPPDAIVVDEAVSSGRGLPALNRHGLPI